MSVDRKSWFIDGLERVSLPAQGEMVVFEYPQMITTTGGTVMNLSVDTLAMASLFERSPIYKIRVITFNNEEPGKERDIKKIKKISNYDRKKSSLEINLSDIWFLAENYMKTLDENKELEGRKPRKKDFPLYSYVADNASSLLPEERETARLWGKMVSDVVIHQAALTHLNLNQALYKGLVKEGLFIPEGVLDIVLTHVGLLATPHAIARIINDERNEAKIRNIRKELQQVVNGLR